MVIDKPDKLTLMAIPAFRRFMLTLIETTGIYECSGSEDRMAFREGRRSVGLEMLRLFDEVQPTPNACGLPADVSIQLLREAVHSADRTKPKPTGVEGAYDELTNQIDAA